ncbi:MAG: DUF3369 domain-containing protein [Pseudodesulfovibrio sp.]|nr:DUF3369 domain-containing protein [Pseudodesulfovibrio sp.]
MANPDDKLFFAAETTDKKADICEPQAWKLLVVDDNEFVHKVTTMVLREYQFKGRGLDILSAKSAEEAKTALKENPDIAVILLDVVMETPHAGLHLAAWIRNELGNHMVRIILRTGQPGEAPEQEVIFKYDINDYKEKAELTAQKLYTTITTSIRSFQDIRTIERNRMGMQQIVRAMPTIFKTQSMGEFASGVLTQLSSTMCMDDDTLMARASGIAAAKQDDGLKIIASTGKFMNARELPVSELDDAEAIANIGKAINEKKSFFSNNLFVGYYRTGSGSENVIYLNGTKPIGKEDQELIELFSSNISVAFDNIDLNQVITKAQKELLFTLGDAVETRSAETANHVRRVAEYSRILALKSGMSEEEANLLRMASPMHDIGKIGIPDAILLNPGRLTPQEFEIIKKHTLIGHEILRKSEQGIMKAAATVALQHHERWDGSGYPHGLKGEEIDIMGRITMLADVFDALGCKRVYKKAWLISDILNFLEEQRGIMFDPKLLDLFMEHLDEFLDIRSRYQDDDQS